ncbi:hypothetical protein BKA67DRAFT_289052 [Truncatella angustata]|uniref:Uncharacterized protein n=1 Tax=Truncatella angustata TaxID=152316 RepID=A0A9P8ZY49_9PEZI|nr:uncharacterized protein BKA67DRAFT_289052 [Truncatella angustata]KAH6654768.1 hypothetical protein BKA67DRAFT_289052 [Truncatella angustata]
MMLIRNLLNNIFIGVGARGPSSLSVIITIQTYVTEAALNRQPFPKTMYYICISDFVINLLLLLITLGLKNV